MNKFLKKTGLKIQRIIDFFYPPFRKFMPQQIFRYAATGGANLVFDFVLFFVIFHFFYDFLDKKDFITILSVPMTPHIAAQMIVFPITLLSGFLLQKYVTFSASYLKGRVQLLRYFSVVIFNLLFIYGGLKLFVDVFKFYPTPSQMVLKIMSAVFSFLLQKNFSFRENEFSATKTQRHKKIQ